MSTPEEDRQRVMRSLMTGTQADREKAAYDDYAAFYGPAAQKRTDGVGTALAAGNAQQDTKDVADLARTHSRFDQGYALEQSGDALTQRRSQAALDAAAANAAAANKPYTFYEPEQQDDPWAAFEALLAGIGAPPSDAVTGPALWTKLAGGNRPAGTAAPQTMEQQIAAGHPDHAVNDPNWRPAPTLPGGHPGHAPTRPPAANWSARLAGFARQIRGRNTVGRMRG